MSCLPLKNKKQIMGIFTGRELENRYWESAGISSAHTQAEVDLKFKAFLSQRQQFLSYSFFFYRRNVQKMINDGTHSIVHLIRVEPLT